MGKLRGYIVLAVAVVMQTCLGGVYAWSVFIPQLQQNFGYQNWQTQLVFGTTIFTFTFSLIVTGRMQDRFGPRPMAIASGLLLSAGYLISWRGGHYFPLLLLGNGVVVGLAIGAGYVCPIATAVKWFPHRRGLVSGLAVAGYGSAAIILMAIAERLMARGWEVLDVFGVVGVIYGPIVVLCGLLLFLPGPIEHREMAAFRRASLVRDQRFWWLVVALFTGSFPGLILLGNIRIIGEWLGNDIRVALAALVAVAIGNSLGRVLWGFVYDWLGGRNSVLLLLSTTSVSAMLIAVAGANGAAFIAAAFAVGFCYGGGFAIYAPQTVRIYGPAVMGSVYPFILLAHGLTAVAGPSIVGWIHDTWASYMPGLVGGGAIALTGLLVCWRWAEPMRKAEAEAGAQPAPPAKQIAAETTAP